MPYSPKRSGLLAGRFAILLDLLGPAFSKDHLGDLSASWQTLRVTLLKHVHHLVGGPHGSLRQRAVSGEIVDKLVQGVEIPENPPSFHVGYDEIGRIQAVVSVLVGRVHPVLPEHLVARCFNVVMGHPCFPCLVRDDELDSPSLVEPSCQACA
jgi:hypothetical protein